MTNVTSHFSRMNRKYDPVARQRSQVAWAISPDPVPYEIAVNAMEARAAEIAAGQASELVWLLEHPPIYTRGTSAKTEDLLMSNRFPVYKTSRGGQFTYHGPGQRIIYVMLDIKRLTGDVRAFVGLLEAWLIGVLLKFGVNGATRAERVGVWVPRPELGEEHEDKIAALGIRVRRWISWHGMSLNVDPDLEHFSGIVPCGIREHGTTSLADLGVQTADMAAVDAALKVTFQEITGDTVHTSPPPA